MSKFRLIALVAALLFIVACGDDDDNGDVSDENGVAVQLLNTGSGALDVEETLDEGIVFCYEGEGCVTHSTGATHIIDEGESQIIAQSDPAREAVGVEVNFNVYSGSGEAEVLSGASREVDGVEEFETSSTMETSDPFTEGDLVDFLAGDTDPPISNNGGGGPDNGFGLRTTNTDLEGEQDDLFDFYWASDPDQWVIFCYDDGECDETTAGVGTTPGSTWVGFQSDPDRNAVGVDVNIVVDEGEGEVELVRGHSYEDDGWEEFTVSSVLDSSGPVSEGDTVTMTAGEIHE